MPNNEQNLQIGLQKASTALRGAYSNAAAMSADVDQILQSQGVDSETRARVSSGINSPSGLSRILGPDPVAAALGVATDAAFATGAAVLSNLNDVSGAVSGKVATNLLPARSLGDAIQGAWEALPLPANQNVPRDIVKLGKGVGVAGIVLGLAAAAAEVYNSPNPDLETAKQVAGLAVAAGVASAVAVVIPGLVAGAVLGGVLGGLMGEAVKANWDDIVQRTQQLVQEGKTQAEALRQLAEEFGHLASDALDKTGQAAQDALEDATELSRDVLDALGAAGKEVGDFGDALVREMQNAMTRRFANFGDPLILDLGVQGLELSSVTAGNAFFNLEDRGFATKTGWTTGEDGFLIQDQNANGKIDGIDELFGSPTQTGFEELRMLDSNADGKITSADADWNTLQVWIDADSDAVTDAGELHTLSELNITEIGLSTTQVNQTIQGNQLVETSSFVMNGQARTAGEVLFQFNPTNSVYAGQLDEVSFDALTLPFLRGYGTVADLPIAMTLDPTLLAMAQSLQTSATLPNFSAFTTEFKNFLFKWAGVEGVVPGSRNAAMWTGADARQLAFMEKYTGLDFETPGGSDPGGFAQWESVGDAFNHALQQLGTRFIIQSDPALQAMLTYDITADEIVLKTHDAATLDAAAPANAQQEALYWSVLAQAQLENDAANDNDIVVSKMNHIPLQVAVGMGRGL